MILRLAPLALLLLAGCGSDSVVTPAEKAAAETWARQALAPAPFRPIALWHAQDIQQSALCGEVEAPPLLRDQRRTLRYVFDQGAERPNGQIEYHAAMMGTKPLADAAIGANRAIFDDLWRTHCAPFAPWRRQLADRLGIELG